MATDKVIGWDDTIEDGEELPEFKAVEPGIYKFRILDYKRGRHEPKSGGKIPACPKAIVDFHILHPETGEKLGEIRKELYLVKSCEWMLASFFRSLGLKKHGQKQAMDWSKVRGGEGTFELSHRKFKKKTDAEGEMTGVGNEIKRFIDAPGCEAVTDAGPATPGAGDDEF